MKLRKFNIHLPIIGIVPVRRFQLILHSTRRHPQKYKKYSNIRNKMIGYCFFNSLLTNKTLLHFLSNRIFLMRPILGNHVLNTLETKNGTFFTRTNFFVCDIFSGRDTWFDAIIFSEIIQGLLIVDLIMFPHVQVLYNSYFFDKQWKHAELQWGADNWAVYPTYF